LHKLEIQWFPNLCRRGAELTQLQSLIIDNSALAFANKWTHCSLVC